MGHETKVAIPVLGNVEINAFPVILVAIGAVSVAVFLLYRRITLIERLGKFLWIGVMLTILWIIFAGVTHFDPKLALDFPPDAFTLRPEFFTGLGAALLVAGLSAGRFEVLGPAGGDKVGTRNLGGTIATAGGLIFIGHQMIRSVSRNRVVAVAAARPTPIPTMSTAAASRTGGESKTTPPDAS